MSNPWSDIYRDLRAPYLQEKKAKKDYDGDGKIESGTDEYMGSRDKAIKKNMGKSVKEGSYDNTYSDNTGKESAEKKKKLEKKRGMKLPNHPQFKKEEKEGAPRMQKGAMAYDGPNKASSEAKDRVFAKTKKKMAKEHHTKDENGKVIEHEDGTPASVPEAAGITAHDVNYGTKAGKDFMSGAKNAAGELKYKLKPAGGMRIKLANEYEPTKSNWREDFVWQDEVEEALKRPKLEIQEKGVKNKVEINPDDGLKEEKKKN